MTDKVENQVDEEVVEAAAPEAEVVELNEIEQQAYKEGWRPKEEFEGDETTWVPADEFMRRKPLFNKISDLKSENYQTRKEVEALRKTLNQLNEHHKKVRETEYNRALQQLQAARKEAIEDRDADAIIQLEERIDEVKQEKREFEQQVKEEFKQTVTAPSPEYVEWVKENGWYLNDQEMHDDADGFAFAYLARHKDATPQQVYSHVTEKIKKAYPEKFEGTPKVTKPSPVDSGRHNAPVKKTAKYELSPMEEEIARNFESRGIMTRAEYIEELKKLDK